MTKPVYRRAMTGIHVLGAMMCFAIVGVANASGAGSCNNAFFLQCAVPCQRTQLRFNFACCNQYGNYCCQRECTLALCSGPQGASCLKPETNEYMAGTIYAGKECINNYCKEP